MKVLIDACVLYPTVLREIVLETAAAGYFDPLWSPRILEEWRRAALRQGHGDIAEIEIAQAERRFSDASTTVDPATEARLALPDPNDNHVLAAAIAGGANELLTLNLRDFPTNALSAEGILRRDPDGFLLEAFHSDAEMIRGVVGRVLQSAGDHGVDVSNPRAVLKRARLPRLAKALYAS